MARRSLGYLDPMARHLIVIDFESIHLHVVRNFGESLWREFKEDKWASASLQEADKATAQLRVTVDSTLWLKRTQARVMKLLARHHLDKNSHVSVFQENA